jgi:hypothetical protein
METQPIELDRSRARELWREYRKHQHYSAPIDDAVRRTYQALAQGKVVIRALHSITAAGLNAEGLPKLAIARADAPWLWLRAMSDGSAVMTTNPNELWNFARKPSRSRIDFAAGSFDFNAHVAGPARRKALVPQVPLPLRPKRGLANYHVLFEAEWQAAPPVDPMLLRRVGHADMWIVCAAWELTEVERGALASRLQS